MQHRLSTGSFKLEIVENDIQKVTMALYSAADKMMMAIGYPVEKLSSYVRPAVSGVTTWLR